MMFYFKKRINVTIDDKCDGMKNDNINIIKITSDDLKNEILSKDYKFRDEYIINKYEDEFNLFFDFDNESRNKEEEETFDKEFCIFLKTLVKYILDNNQTVIDKSKLKSIFSNVYATKSTKPNSYSYHIYFPLVRIKILDMKNIKKLIEKFIKTNSKFTGLDTHVYRKNTSLRFPYSVKSDGQNYYHKIIKIDLMDDDIDEDYFDEEKLKNVNFENYSIRLKNKDAISLAFEDEEVELKQIEIILNDNTVCDKKNLLNDKSPYSYINLEDIFRTIFTNVVYNLKIRNYDILRVNENIKNQIYKVKNPLSFSFNYNKTNCLICIKKKSHKNKHYILFFDLGFCVGKYTKSNLDINNNVNFSNCVEKYIHYPYSLDNYIEFLILNDRIKICNNEIIIFSINSGWEMCNKETLSIKIKETLVEYKDILVNKHFDFIFKTSDKIILESVLCRKNSLEIVTPDKNTFKFRNGIINLITEEFYEFKDSKKIINIFPYTDYDYKSKNEYSKEEMDHYNEFLRIIDEIIPEYLPDKTKNEERVQMDLVFAYSLIVENREMLIIFRGPGGIGKTTILSSLESVFSCKNVAEIEGSELEGKKKSNGAANAFIANMSLKPLIRIREIKQIDENNLKSFTGYKQAARTLYSTNTTTIVDGMSIADTNGLILKIDTFSISRRFVFIDIGFNKLNNKSYSDVYNIEGANHYQNNVDNTIKRRIENGEFSLDAFHYCHHNLKKYLKEKKHLTPTFNKNPMNILTDKFYNKCFLHSVKLEKMGVTINDEKDLCIFLKEDKVEKYTVKRVIISDKFINIVIIKNDYLEYLFNLIEGFLRTTDDTKINIKTILKNTIILQPFILILDLNKKYIKKYKEMVKDDDNIFNFENNEILSYFVKNEY